MKFKQAAQEDSRAQAIGKHIPEIDRPAEPALRSRGGNGILKLFGELRLHAGASICRAVDLRQFGTRLVEIGSEDIQGQCGDTDDHSGEAIERGGKGSDDAGLGGCE